MDIKSTQPTVNISSGAAQVSGASEAIVVPQPQISESSGAVSTRSDEYISTATSESISVGKQKYGDMKDAVGSERIQKEATGVSEKILRDKVRAVNDLLRETNREFSVAVHEKTKSIMVKLIDPDTKKVIKEFPPEKIQDMAAKMMEMAGLLVDEKR